MWLFLLLWNWVTRCAVLEDWSVWISPLCFVSVIFVLSCDCPNLLLLYLLSVSSIYVRISLLSFSILNDFLLCFDLQKTRLEEVKWRLKRWRPKGPKLQQTFVYNPCLSFLLLTHYVYEFSRLRRRSRLRLSASVLRCASAWRKPPRPRRPRRVSWPQRGRRSCG